MSLADIRKIAKLKPPIVVLYGPGGIGKTTFASKMKQPIIVQAEDGIGVIKCDHFPVAKTYTEFVGRLESLINEKSEFKTVCIVLYSQRTTPSSCAVYPFGEGEFPSFRGVADEVRRGVFSN